MPQMTDEEIKKTLECCSKAECWNCPYEPKQYKKGTFGCSGENMKDALDLINRKDAKIAELEAENEKLQKAGEEAITCFNRMESLYKIKCKELEVAKSEAYSEFAERLKENIPFIASHLGNISVLTLHRKLDNVLKELTEKNDLKERD